MSIRYKVFAPVAGALVLGLLLMGLLAWCSISSFRQIETVVTTNSTAQALSQNLLRQFDVVDDLIARVTKYTDFVDAERIKETYGQSTRKLRDALDGLASLALHDDVARATSGVRKLFDAWSSDAEAVLGLKSASHIPTSEQLNRNKDALAAEIRTVTRLAEHAAQAELVAAGENLIRIVWLVMMIGGALTLASGFAGFVVANNISRPLVDLAASAARLQSGETDVVLAGQDRRDEVGTVAASIARFRDSVVERMALEEAARQEGEKQRVRQAKVEGIINGFRERAETLVRSVEDKINQMQGAAVKVAGLAREASSKASSASMASNNAASNVHTVAAASEELSATIADVTDKVKETSLRASEASQAAATTNAQVQTLVLAASKIDGVVTLIKNIAGQTNLLALNATIEAARAGEAGKGFAVVASEVKSLATQTAKATEEIADLVGSIQSSTTNTITAIESITSVIANVNELANAMSDTMMQQSQATNEISSNVGQASSSADVVSQNISGVGAAIEDTSKSSLSAEQIAKDALSEARQLERTFKAFIDEVAAA